MLTAVIVLAACDASLTVLVGVLIRQHERMLRALSASYNAVSEPVDGDRGKHYSMYKAKGDNA